MNNYSLSEVDALCRKASRGAGYSWGLAEESGKAVRWLTAFGLPGAEMLAELLQVVNGEIERYAPKFIEDQSRSNNYDQCPIFCGALISDQGNLLKQGGSQNFQSMLYPLMALPQAARIAEAFDLSVSIVFDDKEIVCTKEAISYSKLPNWEIKRSELMCRKHESLEDASAGMSHSIYPSALSRPIKTEAIKVLEQFAHKTYVPATEASRLAGAGAGLSDND